MDTAHTADSSGAHPVVLHRGVSKSITTLTVVNGGREEGRKEGRRVCFMIARWRQFIAHNAGVT